MILYHRHLYSPIATRRFLFINENVANQNCIFHCNPNPNVKLRRKHLPPNRPLGHVVRRTSPPISPFTHFNVRQLNSTSQTPSFFSPNPQKRLAQPNYLTSSTLPHVASLTIPNSSPSQISPLSSLPPSINHHHPFHILFIHSFIHSF